MQSFLSAWDYAVILVTLVLSAGLGLYHGCYRTRQSTFAEYVLGSRSLPIFPIVMSSFATVTASGFMIGFPSEVYSYGCGTIVCLLSWIVVVPVTNHVFLPVYRQLDSGNIFQFYEIRYNEAVKKGATIWYVVIMGFFASVTVYGPATALSLVTGLHVWIIISIMVGLCMLYTILGGMRAVVFADTIQGLQILVSILVLIIVGIFATGGPSEIWNRNLKGERLQLDFSLDFTVNHGVWSSTVGWTIAYISFFTTNQANIQRLLACPTLRQAQRATIFSVIIVAIALLLTSVLGLLAYAAFFDCDPFSSGKISNMNQIISFYIMHMFDAIPALPGMYFAGLVSASLSTLSSVVNSMSAISVETFFRRTFSERDMSDVKRTNICKILATVYGLLSLLGIFLTEMFPNIFQAAINIGGSMTAPLFGLFIIGVFCPEASRKGCIIALGLSVLVAFWLVTGELLYPTTTAFKPLSVNGCEPLVPLLNSSYVWSTVHSEMVEVLTDPVQGPMESLKVLFPLSNLSYLWLPMIISLTVIICSFVLTYILGRDDVDVKFVRLLPGVVKRCHANLGPKWGRYLLCHYKMADASSENPRPVEDGSHPLQPLRDHP